MSGSTVVTIGNATVSTTGALTGALLKQFESALGAATVVTVGAGASLPASDGAYDQTLIIPTSMTGNITVPAGYEFVIYQGNGSLVGTDPKEVIIGDLNASGTTGTVLASGSVGGVISNSQAGAVLALAGGVNTVSATGAGQKINLDSGTNDVLALATGQLIMQTGGASTVNAGAATSGSNTLVATGGNAVFFGFGTGNDVVSVSGANTSLMFQGEGGTADTIFGGAGSDTVIAGSAVYMGGSGSNLFVGGTGMSTLYGAAKETIYGGTGGGVFSLAANSSNFFVAHGGSSSISSAADAVMLGSGSSGSAALWGNSNEALTIAAAASAPGALVVAYGTKDAIDMTNAAARNTVVMWNADFGPGAFTGNTTLTGASAGHDVIVMFGNMTQLGSTAEGAHTIVINNWQATDILDLSAGYSASDVATATAGLGSGASFTLSDGTTVQFNGAKPTAGQIIHQ